MLYPPFIFSAMWLLVFVVYEANLIAVDQLHLATVCLIGVGAILFSLGGAITYSIPRQIVEVRLSLGPLSRKPVSNHTFKYVLVILLLAGMLFNVRHTFQEAVGGTGSNVLARARSGAGQPSDSEASPLLVYVSVWSTFAATLFLIERRDRTFWTMTGIAFITAVFTTGRVPILMLFSSLISVHLLQTGKLGITAASRFARYPVLLFVSLYILLIFTNKNTTMIDGGISGIVVYFVVSYIVGPVAALDYVLQHLSNYQNEPNHVFKFILGIASKLHLVSYTPAPLLDTFVEVPFPANVYTGYKFFITDFGIGGCLLVILGIGFLHTLLYRKARTGSELGIFLFSYSSFIAVMFIFDDLYSALGEDLNALFFGFLYLSTRRLSVVPTSAPTPKISVTMPRLRLMPNMKRR